MNKFSPSMNRTIIASLIGLGIVLVGASTAFAALIPSFSALSTGSDRIDLTVYADANKEIALYYINTSGSTVLVDTIGSTNTSGYFFRSITRSTYSIPTGVAAYVMVNGERSSNVAWPLGSGSSTTTTALSTSNSGVTLSQGSTKYVSIYGGSRNYYIGQNSNPSAVTATVNGDTIAFYGVNTYTSTASQSATITICDSTSSYGCTSVVVTVPATNLYSNNLGISATQISLGLGQAKALTLTGGGSVSITQNTNGGAVGAYVSGSTLTLYGNQAGTSSITICGTTSGAQCVTVVVTVYNNLAQAPLVAGDITLGTLPYTGDTGPDVVVGVLALLLAIGGYAVAQSARKQTA